MPSFDLVAIFQRCCSFHICIAVSMYVSLPHCISFERRCGRCRSASICQVERGTCLDKETVESFCAGKEIAIVFGVESGLLVALLFEIAG